MDKGRQNNLAFYVFSVIKRSVLEPTQKRGRGRPRKSAPTEKGKVGSPPTIQPPKKRGRPPKINNPLHPEKIKRFKPIRLSALHTEKINRLARDFGLNGTEILEIILNEALKENTISQD